MPPSFHCCIFLPSPEIASEARPWIDLEKGVVSQEVKRLKLLHTCIWFLLIDLAIQGSLFFRGRSGAKISPSFIDELLTEYLL